MSIQYLEKERIFCLHTPNTTYLLGIVAQEGFLGHLYYGKRLLDVSGAQYLLRLEEPPFVPEKNDRDRSSFMDCFPFEYSSHGVGDFRESSIQIRTASGISGRAAFRSARQRAMRP